MGAEAITVILSVILQIPLPLTVLQVLAIDLGTELLPAIALSAEPPEPGVLEQSPRARSRPLLDKAVIWRVFAWLGVVEGVLAMGAFMLAYWSHGWRPGMELATSGSIYMQATTLTYAAIVLAQAGNVFACRTRLLPIAQLGIFTNRALVAGVIASTILMLAMIYIEPLAQIFGFVPPTLTQWLVLATFPFIMLAAHEAAKWWERRRLTR
jgi:magnesium-transporting ATPase (P-type)